MGPYPPFCKVATFHLHFAFILPFHFIVISNSALTPICDYSSCDAHTPPPSTSTHDAATPSFPRLSTANATPSPPVVTTPTPVTKPARAVNGRKRWQREPKRHNPLFVGSRYTFFLFVSSFYKLTNCNLLFLGSILLVTTGADVAQPTPTHTLTTPPPHPNGM
jgi:hypothetical protein